MYRSHWIVTLLFFSVSLARAADFVQVRTFPTHSRLIFKIDDSVQTELKNTGSGFELQLHGVNLADLGSASGSVSGSVSGNDEISKSGSKKLSDKRLETLDVKEFKGGIRILGRWKFPTGSLALAQPGMELFEYRDKSPPQYVIDFWVKEGLTLREVEAKQREEANIIERNKVHDLVLKKQARHLASLKQEEAYLSSMKVCEIPLSEQNDIFLKFNTIHEKVDFTRWISPTTADANFSYYRTMKKNRDAKYVRLALDLYKQGSWGLVVRTLDFLDLEFPHSDYHKEMRFLRANTYLRLGIDRKANEIFKKIILEYDKEEKGSSVALYAAMFLAGKYLSNHLTLAAMDNFLWLTQNYSDYSDAWVFHLGVAESLFELKQTERAAAEYQWIIDNGPNEKAKAEAAFRIGDLYMVRYQYEQAIATYAGAQKELKGEIRAFPSFYLNRGEALYQLGQLELAKNTFLEALLYYPGHPEGWRATFRIGEIEGKDTLDPEKIKESRTWFYDTINRFPISPGSTLARIRLLPCGDHAGMDQFGSEQFFTAAAMNFDGGGDVVLTNYNDYRALAHVRSLVTLGPEDEIGKIAFQELQQVKSPLARKKIILVATESVQRKIMKLISEGKEYEALSFYSVMSPLTEKDVESERVDYLLALSQAASNLGMGIFAEKLSKIYKDKSEQVRKLPNRVIAQALNEDIQGDLELELRYAEEEFSFAKAAWISTSKGEKNLDLIKQKLLGVKEESKFFYEKEIILGLIEEKQGHFKDALSHAANAHMQKPSLRVTAWLANLTRKVDDPKDALNLLQDVEVKLSKFNNKEPLDEAIESNLGVPPVPHLAAIIVQEGEILEKMEKWNEASTKYFEAIKIGQGGNQLVYQYARSLIKTGDSLEREKAIEVLQKLSTNVTKNEKEEFWRKMAQSVLWSEKGKELVN